LDHDISIDEDTRKQALKSFLKGSSFDNPNPESDQELARMLQEHCDNRKETALKKREQKLKQKLA